MHANLLLPKLVCLSLVFLGALMMWTSTFGKSWGYAQWVKIDFGISGVVAIVVVTSKAALLLYGDVMSRFNFLSLDYVTTLLMGVPLGLVMLFVLSGELTNGFRRSKKEQQGKEE